MTSFLIPVKLGCPISRLIPDEIVPYVEGDQWQSFCDEFDRISMNCVDRNSTIFMRLSLTIAIACLVLVILFGYLDSGDDGGSSSTDDDDEGGGVSTILVLVTAIPICFPFIMAAVLNCHNAATISKLLDHCRTCFQEWGDANAVKVTVEQLQTVCNTDEAIDKFLVQFGPAEDASKEHQVDMGSPPEARPESRPTAPMDDH